MSSVMPVLQALVRHEMTASRPLAIGSVTTATTNEGGSGDHNLEVNVRLHGSDLELQRLPVTVGRLGLSVAPRVGDLALVGFVDGDVNGGVVLGFLYDHQNHPPDAKVDELVYEVPDDASGARRCEMRLPNGNTLTVVDDTVTVKMGGTSLIVESDGNITLDAAGDVVLKAGGNISLKASQDVSIEAGTNLTAKASANASLEGSAAAKLKGGTTTIAGMTSFSAG
jgi:phage baseplate assembly protein gpV